MIRAVTILCLLSIASCQYQRQRAPPVREAAPYYDEEQLDDRDYAPQPQPQPRIQPQPEPRRSSLYRPASVHYVNIGQELAGDYKFGYDTGKGDDGQSFREETRLPDGTVQGAYGYVDESGKQRIVKYTAGKDGFKIIGDGDADKAARPAPSRPQTQQAAPQSYQPAPQPAYRAPPQPVQRATPQPAYRAPPQPVYRAPPQAPQPAYRAPAPQPAYRAPTPQRYEPEVYTPRQRSQNQPPRRQYQEPVKTTSEEDYDYPDNDIGERRIVPIDTSLFNYNIGTRGNK